MTVANTNARMDYLGNGATGEYAYTFMVPSASDLLLIMASNADPPVLTTLVLGTDYTVDVAGPLYPNGGNVILETSTNLPSGVIPDDYTLSIIRNTSPTQPTSIRNQGAYFPDVLEDSLDRLCLEVQDVQAQATQALVAPQNEPGPFTIPFKAVRANKVLGFDNNGNPIAATVATTAVSAFMAAVVSAANQIAAIVNLLSPVIFQFANNVASKTNVTGLVVTGSAPGAGGLGACIIKGNIRLTKTGSELCSIVTLSLVYRQTGTTWSMSAVDYELDDLSAQLTFYVTAAGQIQYESANNGYTGQGAFSIVGAWNA